MIIVFDCPGCGASLRMKEKYGGQRGRCPHCQGAITVPSIVTDEGMDLLPMEGTAPQNPPAASAPPAAPPSATPASPFSLGSRLRPPTAPLIIGGAQQHVSGDSNIGLAPLDDPAAKRAAPPAPAQPAAAPAPRKASGPDEDFGLAPLEEGAASKGAKSSAASSAPSTAAAHEASASKPGPAADERQRIVCTQCGAGIRVPASAAGKQITCPRCKHKQRVPGEVDAAAAGPAKHSSSDAISLEDATGSGQDLGIGVMDMLGESVPLTAANDAAAPATLVASPKSSAKRARSDTILGLPPIAVYGGAAGLTVLVLGLIAVYMFTGGGGGSVPTTTGATQVAQAPSPAPAAPSPTAPASPVPAPVAPRLGGPSAGAMPPAAGSPPATNPAAPPPAATPSAPSPFGTLPIGTPRPTSPPPGGTPAVETPAPAAPAPVVPAAPIDWRMRIPMVRMAAASPVSFGGITINPGGTETPQEPVTPKQLEELLKVPDKALALQRGLLDLLAQVTDAELAQRQAPKFGELTAQGLEFVKQLRRVAGARLNLGQRAKYNQAVRGEDEVVAQIEAAMDRIAQVPGALAPLDAEVQDRAAKEPKGALAEALKTLSPQ